MILDNTLSIINIIVFNDITHPLQGFILYLFIVL